MSKELQEMLDNIRPLYNELINLLNKDKITEKALLDLDFVHSCRKSLGEKYVLTVKKTDTVIDLIIYHSSDQDAEVYLGVGSCTSRLENCKTLSQLKKLIEALKGE